MNTLIKIFSLSTIAILLVNCKQTKEAPIKLNILWIMAEDMSTDLECYGMEAVKTPILNQLASEGVRYTNAFGTNSICSPSRSNMMTGIHQNVANTQHHRSNRDIPLMAPYKPITSYLREAGYTCILGSHLAKGKSQKVDVNFKHKAVGNWNGETEFGLFDKLDTIKESDEPFFSQITLNVTHRGDWWKDVSNDSKHRVNPAEVVLPPYFADTQLIREDWARYLDQIEYMDNEVGLILDDLEQKGLKENTIVVFIGDNGRCNMRGKGYLYDPGLRLPLIVNWPAHMTGGKVDERLVSSIDVAASILDFAGIELPTYMTAKPLLNNAEPGREYVYSARDLWDEVLEQSRAISTKEFRYIKNNIVDQPLDAKQAYLEFYRPAVHTMRTLNENGELNELQSKFFSKKESEELYDLINDPYETNNLANDPKYAKELAKMKSYYTDWQENNKDYGLEEMNWDNAVIPRAPGVLKWLETEKPEIITQMKQGIEPGFGKLVKQYNKKNEN